MVLILISDYVERERERDRERQRETERQRQRETERETERQRDRETEREEAVDHQVSECPTIVNTEYLQRNGPGTSFI